MQSGLEAGKAIKEIYKKIGLKELYEEYEEAFCSDAEIILPDKVKTVCEGPIIALEYKPKECIVSEDEHSITCEPGKIVTSSFPG